MSSIIINNLKNIEKYSYLELGVGNNNNFLSIQCKNKFSVDITPGVALYTGTTDSYFDQLSDHYRYDIIFIDANHDYDYVCRDFNNSIKRTNHWVLLHDMIPQTELDATKPYCSDGYKVLYHMLKYENFEIYPMNCNHGFTLVKMPAKKIILNDETKNLSYHDFKNFLISVKLYNDLEIINLLQNYQ